MATINKQAIKFLGENETPFNDKVVCGLKQQEDWAYVFTDGDTIDFQIDGTCQDSDDTILNGSFELGEGLTSITDWTRVVDLPEQTRVDRVLDTASPCGTYYLKFSNVDTTPNLASVSQTQTITLGKSYKIKLKAKIETGGEETNNILEIIVGGVSYYITPTTSWQDYELIINVTSAPSDSLIVIKMNEIPTSVQAIYVDCFEMSEYLECCLYDRVNNGCFELGQLAGEVVSSTADNWVGVFSDTEGENSTRCAVFPSIGDGLTQEDVFGVGRNIIKFKAKSVFDGAVLQVYSMPSNTLIGTVTLSTSWEEYYLDINTVDTDIKFVSATDETIYVDCVYVTNLQELNITIIGQDGEEIAVAQSCATIYENYINVSIPIDDYDFPSCFKVCVDYCQGNLFLNSNFSLGNGNLFTYWTLVQPSRTNLVLQSQNFGTTWGGSAIVSINTTIAPDGTLTADTLNDNSNVFLDKRQTVTVSTVNNTTISVYIKKTTTDLTHYPVVGISLGGGFDTCFAILDTTNGTVNLTDNTLAVVFYGAILEDDYWRVYLTFLSTYSSCLALFYPAGSLNGVTLDSNAQGTNIFWGVQIEESDYMTPYIPTTTTSVTTSFGSIIQDSTGGLNGGRALKLWAGGSSTYFVQNVLLEDATEYTITFWAKVDALYGNDYLTTTSNAVLIDSLDWKKYECNFTQIGTSTDPIAFEFDNDSSYGFIYLDNVSVYKTSDIVPLCSEDMKYTQELDGCLKELTWYDGEDVALGINYASGFKNKVRVKAQLQNPNYIKEDFVKTTSTNGNFINSSKVRKTQELSIDSIPEFLWDRISQCVAVSNVEYDGEELAPSIDSELSINYDKNTLLYSGSVTLSPKDEYIVNRTYNCN